jgi:signal transduction histidine kinase
MPPIRLPPPGRPGHGPRDLPEPHTTALATWSSDIDRRILRGDATLAAWLQIDPAEMSAGVAVERFVACVVTEDRSRIEAVFSGVVPGGELELRMRGPDGTERQMVARASLITPEHVAGAFVDLTGDTEAANRTEAQFLAMLAHELRNPLAPILGAVQLMQLRGDGENERERKVIQRQVENLVVLVDDLLDISRITRGQLSIERQPIELAEIVARATETSAPLFLQNRHQLVVDVAPGLVVDADRARMTQVVANLMSNAAKYTPVGGRIAVIGALDRGDVVLHVEDNGVGIASNVLPRVFDVFVQANPTTERSHGMGLGLSIVQSIVTMHGGTVEVHSEGIGRGARFTVRLPRAGVEAVVRPPRAAQRCGRGRVLVVDDNRDTADVMARSLMLLGYEVETAHDGQSGLAAAGRFAPQVILLDLAMPLMDGDELARRLRADGHPARLVALTAHGNEAELRRSREAGIGDHLVKPGDPDWQAF